jgi:hypothetical protein
MRALGPPILTKILLTAKVRQAAPEKPTFTFGCCSASCAIAIVVANNNNKSAVSDFIIKKYFEILCVFRKSEKEEIYE